MMTFDEWKKQGQPPQVVKMPCRSMTRSPYAHGAKCGDCRAEWLKAKYEKEITRLRELVNNNIDSCNTLNQEIDRLRELVKEAYTEGWYDGYDRMSLGYAWEHSEIKKELEK